MIIRLAVLYLTLTSTAATSIITPLPGAVVVDGKTAGLPTLTLDRSMTLTRHVGLLARAASLSLLACAAPAESGGLDPAELTSVEVTPPSVTMAPNASQVFSAQGFWSDGSHGTVPVIWTVSGGSMAANGAYTASATPGTYVVRAVFQGGGYGDSALVTVDSSAAPPPPPPTPNLISLDVTPASATLSSGEKKTFAAVGQWSDSVARPVTVVWSSTGGTVSNSGSYTAGPTVGNFVVRAFASGTSIGDSATVEIWDSTSPPSPQLVALDVTPPSVTIDPGASRTFVAQGQWSDSISRPVAVVWSATGGTISSSGAYTAGPTGGNFVVRAIASGTSIGDSATVVVRDTTSPPPPPQLVSLDVTPASVTLDPGASRTFVAQGRWSDSVSRPVTVVWSATGGTVSSTGTYTAGPSDGNFLVRAIASGTSIGDSAAVVVRDTTSPPPPPPPTTLVQEGFEDTGFATRGWYDNTNLTITAAEHRPGGTKSLQATFNQGSTTPTFGGSMRIHFTPTESVYLSYWVKYSSNWVGSGVSYHPHEFQFITTDDGQWIGPSATHLTTYVEHNYQNGGIPILSMQDALNIDTGKLNQDLSLITENRAAAGCNGNTDGYATSCYQSGTEWRNGKQWKAAQSAFKPAPGPGYKNDWHHVEAYFQLNTIQGGKGQLNGIARYWFDGQLLIDHQDVLFRTGIHSTMKFNQFLIAPYIGVGSPVTQTMWVDDLVIQSVRP